ncbi:hypothetical protein FQR65_LT16906 [Abscondita terminalis]|nr:hypothetical protein FQR65_LT16906 [Abscondita terminalis]
MIYLICKEKDCKAKAKCNESVFITFDSELHNHLPDFHQKESLQLKDQMIKEAVFSSAPFRSIYVGSSSSVSVEAAAKVSFPTVSQSMRRERKKCQPSIPHTIGEYGDVCRESLRFGSIDEKPFCRGVVGHESFQSVLFLAEDLKDVLSNSKEIHIDGTFKTRPRHPNNSQLLTIIAIQYGLAIVRQSRALIMRNLLRDNLLARKAFKFLLCLALLPAEKIEEGLAFIKQFIRTHNLENNFESLISHFETTANVEEFLNMVQHTVDRFLQTDLQFEDQEEEVENHLLAPLDIDVPDQFRDEFAKQKIREENVNNSSIDVPPKTSNTENISPNLMFGEVPIVSKSKNIPVARVTPIKRNSENDMEAGPSLYYEASDSLEHRDYSDSGSEYIPSDESSSVVSNSTDRTVSPEIQTVSPIMFQITNRDTIDKYSITPCNSKRKIQKKIPTDEGQGFVNDVDTNSVVIQNAEKNNFGKRIRNKRHACYFCHKLLQNMSRHFETKHFQEIEVAKVLAISKNSKKRRDAFGELIEAGDFYHNCEVLASKTGELILVRRPTPAEAFNLTYEEYGPCSKCLGFLLKKHQIESSAILNEILSSQLSPEFLNNVVDKLRVDDIAIALKGDDLVMRFGSFLYEKYSDTQQELIRQSMRQLGRLILHLRTINSKIQSLSDALTPENFDSVINATKKLCVSLKGSITSRSEFGIPSLALKIGYALKKCIGIQRGQCLRQGDIVKDKKLVAFEKLLELEWSVKISSNALATLQRKNINIAINDVKKLKTWNVWAKLISLTLARVILFNKRRSGEAARMTVQQYISRPIWNATGTEVLKESLTPFEKNLAEQLHDNAVELAKVSRLLIAVDQGSVKKFAGKSLEQISMEDLPKIVEDPEEEEEEDSDEANDNYNELNINITSSVREDNDLTLTPTATKKQKKSTHNRQSWTSEEIQLVLSTYRTLIKQKKLPGKLDCEKLMKDKPTLFKGRKWSDIKFYVKNHITKMQK